MVFPALNLLMLLLIVAMTVVLAVVLVRAYLRTRNPGYLVLTLGLPVWHLLGGLNGLLSRFVVRAVRGDAVIFPYTLITDGRVSVGQVIAAQTYVLTAVHVGIVLVGVWMVARRDRGPQAALSPVRSGEN